MTVVKAQAGEGRRSRVGAGWWIFVLLACAHFSYRYVLQNASVLNLPLYANEQEAMPFQGRILMAWVLHWTAQNTHFSGILWRLASFLPEGIRNPYDVVLLLVDYLATIEAMIVGRWLLEELTLDPIFSAWASLLTLYMSYFNLIVGYGLWNLPYDIPSLAIFVTSMWLILAKRYWLLLLAVTVGSFNRETIVFVPIILGLYTWFRVKEGVLSFQYAMAKVLPHVVLQIAVWAGVRTWIAFHLTGTLHAAGAPSDLLWLHLRKNLISLAKPPQWPLFLSLFGFTLPFLFLRLRRIADGALARTAVVTLLLWTAIMLVEGVVVEIRVFNEMTAVVMPCIALIVRDKLHGGSKSPRTQS
jgi:hypothetical protein